MHGNLMCSNVQTRVFQKYSERVTKYTRVLHSHVSSLNRAAPYHREYKSKMDGWEYIERDLAAWCKDGVHRSSG